MVHLAFCDNHLKIFLSMRRMWKQEALTALTFAVIVQGDPQISCVVGGPMGRSCF